MNQLHATAQLGSLVNQLHATAQLGSLVNQLQAIECFIATVSVFGCCTIPLASDATRLLAMMWVDALDVMPGTAH